MKDLSKHISKLLKENGCVIIPGFGGFVSQHVASRILEGGKSISSPYSEIGFNENLKINDGLLVQSYMIEDGISYSAAEKKVLRMSKDLKRYLYKNGELTLPEVGHIRISMNGHLIFVACKDTLVDTNTYGFTSINVPLLSELKKEREKSVQAEVYGNVKRSIWTYAQYAAACILVLMLYFSSSVSIDNTSLYRYDNKASVVPTPSFIDEKVGSEVVVITDNVVEHSKTAVNEERAVKVANVEKTEVKHQVSSKGRKYHIIIASLGVGDDYETTVSKLKKEGYRNAEVIKGNGRIRISIESFDDYNEAIKNIEVIRTTTKYKDAWVLNKK